MAQSYKKILVLGGNGALGAFVVRHLMDQGFSVQSTGRREIEIKCGYPAAVFHSISAFKADAVINLAGYGREIAQSRPFEDVLYLNSVFPQELGRYLAPLNVPLIHISTDCVFSGKGGPYDESSFCDAEDVYGLTKAAADSARGMILRGSFLGPGLSSHPVGLLEWIISKRNQTVGGFNNQYWNGITHLKLAQVIGAVLKHGLYTEGVFHLPSVEAVSRKDLILMVNRIYHLGIQVIEEISPRPVSRLLRTQHNLLAPWLCEPLEAQVIALRDWQGQPQEPLAQV